MKTLKSKMHPGGILLILVLTLALASLGVAAEGIWTKKADMPTARFFLGTCVVDGKIYAIGGAQRPYVGCATVEEYDPVTDTWTRKSNMSTARVGPAVSVVNGKIYAIGGTSAGAPSVEEYDPSTDKWTHKADMPTVRSFFTTSVVNGKIYAIGGALGTDGPAFSAVEEYDPATDTWTPKADLPEPRYLHAAGVVDGKIYIITGSWQAYTASRAVFAYDPATDTWERKADAPTVGSWLSASVADGRIYVIGIGEGAPPKGVEEYDPATDTWTTRKDMPTARAGLSTCELDGKIYAIGGTAAPAYSGFATVEEYYANPLVVDFNGDGSVDGKDLLIMTTHWGEAYPFCDISPAPFGDGVVDLQDVIVLAEYIGEEVNAPTLIAHWALDETEGTIAQDTASTCDGAVIGAPVWHPDAGRVDGALELDGSTFVATDHVLNPADGSFSVLAWIQTDVPGQVIISQADGANWLYTDSMDGSLMTELKGTGRDSCTLCSETIVADGNWHRIALACDGEVRSLYVDDLLAAQDTQAGGPTGCAGGLNIGCDKDMIPGSYFTGLIDDVRIYNRAVRP